MLLSLRSSVESLDLSNDAVVLSPADRAKVKALPCCIPVPNSDVEYKRLDIVRQTGLLQAHDCPDFDRIVNLASRCLGIPFTIISVLDVDFACCIAFKVTPSFKGHHNVPRFLPRNPYCSATLMPDAPDVYMPETFIEYECDSEHANEIFKHLQFYASTPLVIDGIKIGTLALMDYEPHAFSAVDKMNLLDLGMAASEYVRLSRDTTVRMNEERSNLLLSMTANLQNPVTSLKSISAELKAGMAAAEDAALSAALTSTVDDFDTALRSLETLMTTSLSFGKLVSEYKGQAEHVSCDVLHLMDHIRAASIAHDHIEWEVQEHSFRRSTHRPCTFPDAICFAMISALSELGPQWRRIRASVAYTEEDLDAVGRARRVEFVPSTETLGVLRRESQSTERVHGFIRFAIDVAESVTGAADESADYNSSSMRRDFTHIHHVLRAVNGAAQEQTHSSGRLFSYSVPCYLEPHHCENNGHNDAALMPFSILFADETFFNKTSLYEAFPPDAELHIATNGKAAAAVLQLQAFDVVFFEFLLPVMSGIELMEHHCAWLRSQQGRSTETTLFVGMTASPNDEELRACFNSGMHVFCPKPVSARVVTEILSARRLSSTLEDAIAMIRSIDDVMLGD